MRRKLLAIPLAVLLMATLVLGSSAMALESKDFSGAFLSGIAADGNTLLVTDTFNKVVWSVEGGTVTRIAGKITDAGLNGVPVGGYFDGNQKSALFMEPWDIVPFLDGYAVSDAAANVIRYIGKNRVYTAAGTGKSGYINGVGIKASFDRPTGLAVDQNGSLYIADTGNGVIRRMDTKGKVITWAIGLVEPTGICWADGGLYVAETGRNRICRIEDGKVTALAGNSTADLRGVYIGGYVDGPVEKAMFEHPQGVAVGPDGTIYVADTGNGAVRKISDGRVTTMAAASQTPEAPVEPRGLLLRSNGTLLVTDLFAQTLLELSTDPVEYSDVPADYWCAQAVAEATERGLVSGTGEGEFSPEAPVTKAVFIEMLSRMHLNTDGDAVINGDAKFSDMPADAWYADAARWAADAGIVEGSGGKLQAESTVSIQELVTMLYRYGEKNGYIAGEKTGSDNAADPVSWAVAGGLMSGMNGDTMNPGDTATRAQAASILTGFMDMLGI